MIDNATDIVKEIILRQKDINIAVDMTAGNGHDSKFILDKINPEKLLAFDIQKKAQENTEKLIGKRENFQFILDSHENIDKYIKEKADLIIYNLGYLPKGDKSITTKWQSTIRSLEKSIDLISDKGKIIITVYPGHKEGAEEARWLEKYLKNLDYKKFNVLKINYINKINKPPYTYIIGKRVK